MARKRDDAIVDVVERFRSADSPLTARQVAMEISGTSGKNELERWKTLLEEMKSSGDLYEFPPVKNGSDVRYGPTPPVTWVKNHVAKLVNDGGGRITQKTVQASLKKWETKLYKEAEETARDEGFEEIATVFKEIGEVEEEHEKRYRKLLKNIKEGKVFKRDTVVKWKCRNCGYVHEGKEAPEECPACAHEQKYYELLCENY